MKYLYIHKSTYDIDNAVSAELSLVLMFTCKSSPSCSFVANEEFDANAKNTFQYNTYYYYY